MAKILESKKFRGGSLVAGNSHAAAPAATPEPAKDDSHSEEKEGKVLKEEAEPKTAESEAEPKTPPQKPAAALLP